MAKESGEKWHSTMEITINLPVDKTWDIIGNFCECEKWVPSLHSCEKVEGEYQTVGCVRYLVGDPLPGSPPGSKLWARETLIAFDTEKRSLSYRIDGSSVAAYEGAIATIQVWDGGNGTTNVRWEVKCNPVPGETEEVFIKNLVGYQSSILKELEERVTKAVVEESKKEEKEASAPPSQTIFSPQPLPNVPNQCSS